MSKKSGTGSGYGAWNNSKPFDYDALSCDTTKAIVNAPRNRRDTRDAKRQARRAKLWAKPFIVWDGEGARAAGKRKPQNYVLLGYYDGINHEYITGEALATYACLEFIVQAGKDNPDAWHVGFAFDYDVNMILRSLAPSQFEYLAGNGFCRIGKYRVEHIPGKWFRVTEYGPLYPDVKTNKTTVTIYDIWGFFQGSFLNAIRTTIADHPVMARIDEIERGKAGRKSFTYDQLEFITEYWKVENILLWALINRLREMLYSVGLFISKWHGPGALASFVYTEHSIKQHKADCGPVIYDCARFAYAGGRFERFLIGRHTDAWGYDINSAYPNAIAMLPSLTEGIWTHVDNPTEYVEFGMYYVKMKGASWSNQAGPLFHRDLRGEITYPFKLEGWYWSPELKVIGDELDNVGDNGAKWTVTEGWEYTGWHTRPFAFVRDMYEQRREMKAAKNGAQMALKLALNSLYGKMAQRAGWERTGGAPRWHQLEWAGWVTSYARAMLYDVMRRIPVNKLIAVETDGIFTTATPDELGITDSKELGEWEVKHYDEIVYLQSGVYAKRDGEEWSIKFRGLDRETFGATTEEAALAIVAHSRKLVPNIPPPITDWMDYALGIHEKAIPWEPIRGTTTRFIGYQNALFRQKQNRGPMKAHHRVWETEDREISCGKTGKRVHSAKLCPTCKAGFNSYERAHWTIIKSRTMFPGNLVSQRHDIPWIDSEQPQWRKDLLALDGMIPNE